MKVVSCKNCGAKYQLDDSDDINAFECSSCAGDLEYVDDYPKQSTTSNSQFVDTYRYDNSQIVQCEDCGLKYKIKSSDNILDYECDSCGGSLRYLDNELNKELDRFIEDRKKYIQKNENTSPNNNPVETQERENRSHSLKSFTNKLETFFSEDHMQQIAYEDKLEQELDEENFSKTARTTIPIAVLSKFGHEFTVPKSSDYDTLKNFLKEEFFKSMDKYYPNIEKTHSKKGIGNVINKISIKEPETGIVSSKHESSVEKEDFDIKNISINQMILAIGSIIFILSIAEILTIDSGAGIIALFIGVILLCYGIYRTKDVQESEERTRILRERLLTLPNEYYVFYNVKTPTASSGINHLVVGPTGIYALISQKLTSKNKLNAENENLKLINSYESDKYSLEEVPNMENKKRFRYTTKQAKFSQDNDIKQKALLLGEDLINFLNDNNIKNCFVEPLIGFINNEVVVINMPLTDEDLFIEELLYKIQNSTIKLDSETIDKCAVLINQYSADCSSEI